MRFSGFLMGVFLCGMPLAAADAGDSAPALYNAGTGASATPVFIQPSIVPQTSYGMQGTTPYIPPEQRPGGGGSVDYATLAKQVDAMNARDNASRLAEVRAAYAAQEAQDKAIDSASAQIIMAQKAAEAKGQGKPGDKQNAAPADPLAGKTVVFVDKPNQKTDKPVRLFNVR